VKTRKKGILFFAVVAGIMLTSAVTLAVNPAQWVDDSSDFDEMTQEELDAFDLDALGLGYSGDELSQFCSTNKQARVKRICERIQNTHCMHTTSCNYGRS